MWFDAGQALGGQHGAAAAVVLKVDSEKLPGPRRRIEGELKVVAGSGAAIESVFHVAVVGCVTVTPSAR
jgi:hypothetical protein